MNPLSSLLLVANPIVTAALTILVFLESKKNKAHLASIERAIRESSQAVIASVERQKEGFDAIAVSLKAIADDQEKSVETFTGISGALMTSSTTNQQSLNRVVAALDANAVKNEETTKNLAERIGSEYKTLTARLAECERGSSEAVTKQQESNTTLAQQISTDVTRLSNSIDSNSKELAKIESTLSNAVSI